MGEGGRGVLYKEVLVTKKLQHEPKELHLSCVCVCVYLVVVCVLE